MNGGDLSAAFSLFVRAVLLSWQARTRVTFAMALLDALCLLLILVQLFYKLLGVLHCTDPSSFGIP